MSPKEKGAAANGARENKSYHPPGLNNSTSTASQHEASPTAEILTFRAGGIWLDDHGIARCPCCERLDSLTIENGNRAVLVSCSHGCCRRAIISIFRARGLLDQGGRP